MKTNADPADTLPREYTDKDIHDYAHHLWIQRGMPCGSGPWDEAKACFETTFPREGVKRPIHGGPSHLKRGEMRTDIHARRQ